MDTSATPGTSISDSLSEAARLLAWLRQTEETEGTITAIGARLAQILDAGGRLLTCGNGGSMCDAMHFAEELSGQFRDPRPAVAALAISESLIRPTVASAAAQHTGLPPNVLACEPGGQVMTSARAVVTPSGSPEAMPFAIATMSGSTPKCSIANIFPVRPIPDCTSSVTRSIPCFCVNARRR